MFPSPGKKINFRALSTVALHLMIGALILLGIQARLSRHFPREGLFRYLSAATKMIPDRSIQRGQTDNQTDDRLDPCRVELPAFELISDVIPAPVVLITPGPNQWHAAYYLRPPPSVS